MKQLVAPVIVFGLDAQGAAVAFAAGRFAWLVKVYWN